MENKSNENVAETPADGEPQVEAEPISEAPEPTESPEPENPTQPEETTVVEESASTPQLEVVLEPETVEKPTKSNKPKKEKKKKEKKDKKDKKETAKNEETEKKEEKEPSTMEETSTVEKSSASTTKKSKNKREKSPKSEKPAKKPRSEKKPPVKKEKPKREKSPKSDKTKSKKKLKLEETSVTTPTPSSTETRASVVQLKKPPKGKKSKTKKGIKSLKSVSMASSSDTNVTRKSTIRFTQSGTALGRLKSVASTHRSPSRKFSSHQRIRPSLNFSVFSFDTWDSDEEDEEDEGDEGKTPPTVPTEEVKSEKKEKQKKAKKKKEKKKKVAKDESEVEEIQESTVATPTVTETVSEAPSKPTKKKSKKKRAKSPGGPKKKLSKKEKLRLAAEMAEKARIEAEQAAIRQAEEERIRLEQEKRAAIEKDKREMFEQQIRCEQLEKSQKWFDRLVATIQQLNWEENEQEEWDLYVNCGRLPNPSKYDQMNTFLHLWEKTIDETTIEDAASRTKDVLQLLNDLDDLIDTTEHRPEIIKNWKWIRLLFREFQAKSLDVATYRLLRNIEKNLNRIDIPTADFHYQDENFAMCLWLKIQLPTPLPNPRKPARNKIEINFPEIKMDVLFPISVDGEKMAVRALYTKYDHLSDLSTSYARPPVPPQYQCGLYEATKMEWRKKQLYKYENRVRPPPPEPLPGEPGEPEILPEPIIGPTDPIPIVPYRKLEPSPSEFVLNEENQLYTNVRNSLQIGIIDDSIINLRKFTVIGGVFALHLIEQPPQPQEFVTLELNLTLLSLPKQLEFVDFLVDYNPPPPAEPGVRRLPEEIEEEMKKQEEEFDKLILITLTWPDHVIFLELPIVCFWDVKEMVWRRDNVHDVKHNEEKGQLSFRTGKCGIFALATYKYANLPYQAWEIRPEQNGTINVQITAAILLIEFTVKGGLIALTQLQNSPNNAMQDILNVYFKLPKLIRIMQQCGVDLFPAFDAFCYIESGACEKHWPMEKNLYYNMAQLSECFNFAWSRWNLTVGRRSVVMQMREYNVEKIKQKTHSMVMVTPLKALYIDCTEVSQTFNEDGIENMKFYSDLYTLVKGTTSMALQNKIKQSNGETVYALYQLLMAVRPVSFS